MSVYGLSGSTAKKYRPAKNSRLAFMSALSPFQCVANGTNATAQAFSLKLRRRGAAGNR